jgi:hypothetical protein
MGQEISAKTAGGRMKLDFSFDEFEKHESPAVSQPTRDLRDGERMLLLDQVRQLRFGRAEERKMQGGHRANELSKKLRLVEDQLIDYLSFQLGYFAFTWPEHRIAVRVETKTLLRNGSYDGTTRLAIYG